MPRKVLLLPADIRVHEVSAGGVVEKVDDWSDKATAHAMKAMREIAASRGLFELQHEVSLATDERALLDQHLALYEVVASSADFARSGPIAPWRERAKAFDYSIGPGLKHLAESNGVDAALILIGSDYVSSAGRKATMVLGVLAAAFTGVVIVPAGGTSYVSVGIVDLRTGDLLWFSTNRDPQSDLREEAEFRGVLELLFKTYPGAAAKSANVKS